LESPLTVEKLNKRHASDARLSAGAGGVWRTARGTDGPGAWPPPLRTTQNLPTATPRPPQIARGQIWVLVWQ